MRIFILEDDPERIKRFRQNLIGCDVTVCMNVADAKVAWSPKYDLMLLDHDLGGRTFVDQTDENCGTAFVRFLTEYYKDLGPEMIPYTLIHSWNFAAADWMQKWLDDFGAESATFPFGESLLATLRGFLMKEQESMTEKEREQQAQRQTQEFGGWSYFDPDALFD